MCVYIPQIVSIFFTSINFAVRSTARSNLITGKVIGVVKNTPHTHAHTLTTNNILGTLHSYYAAHPENLILSYVKWNRLKLSTTLAHTGGVATHVRYLSLSLQLKIFLMRERKRSILTPGLIAPCVHKLNLWFLKNIVIILGLNRLTQ